LCTKIIIVTAGYGILYYSLGFENNTHTHTLAGNMLVQEHIQCLPVSFYADHYNVFKQMHWIQIIPKLRKKSTPACM